MFRPRVAVDGFSWATQRPPRMGGGACPVISSGGEVPVNSKQIQDECAVGESVVTTGRTWAAEVASRRAAQLAKLGLAGPGTEAEVGAALARDMDALAARGELLRRADASLDAAERAVPDVAARRDEAHRRLWQGLVLVREVVGAVAGDAAARDLGFDGASPRDPAAAEGLAERVLARVPSARLLPRTPGVTLDLRAVTVDLAADHAALAQANADLREARRSEQLARVHRDELRAEYTRERESAAERLVADLRAAGLDGVAERLLAVTRAAAADSAPPRAPRRTSRAAPRNSVQARPVAEPRIAPSQAPMPMINTRPSQAPAPPS